MISNTLAVVMLRGITTVVRLFVLFVIARFTSPSTFGSVSLTLTVVEIAKFLADFGVDTIAIREFVLRTTTEEREQFASTVACVKSIFAVLVYSIFLLISLWYSEIFQLDIAFVLGLLIVTGLWSNFSIGYFQAQLRMQEVFLVSIFGNILTSIFIVSVFVFYPSVILGLIAMPAAEGVSAFLLSSIRRRELKVSIRNIQLQNIKNLLQLSWPVAMSTMIITLYSRLDVMVLARLYDVEQVGYYSVAYRLTEPFQLVAVAFALTVYSQFSAVIAHSTSYEARRFMIKYIALIVFYGLTVGVFLIVSAPLLIKWFLPDYQPSVVIVGVLSIALVFRTLNSCFSSMIRAYGHHKYLMYLSVWNFCAVCVSLWTFLPLLGVVGAAVALLISEFVNTVIQMLLLKFVSTN